jgi:hypothetical protein
LQIKGGKGTYIDVFTKIIKLLIYQEVDQLKLDCNAFQKQLIALWICGGLSNIIFTITTSKTTISKEKLYEQFIYIEKIILKYKNES